MPLKTILRYRKPESGAKILNTFLWIFAFKI